jgi:hypothetical protein
MSVQSMKRSTRPATAGRKAAPKVKAPRPMTKKDICNVEFVSVAEVFNVLGAIGVTPSLGSYADDDARWTVVE